MAELWNELSIGQPCHIRPHRPQAIHMGGFERTLRIEDGGWPHRANLHIEDGTVGHIGPTLRMEDGAVGHIGPTLRMEDGAAGHIGPTYTLRIAVGHIGPTLRMEDGAVGHIGPTLHIEDGAVGRAPFHWMHKHNGSADSPEAHRPHGVPAYAISNGLDPWYNRTIIESALCNHTLEKNP